MLAGRRIEETLSPVLRGSVKEHAGLASRALGRVAHSIACHTTDACASTGPFVLPRSCSRVEEALTSLEKRSLFDPSTLESRRARGLYLCGEILDVDGRLGGSNFQWVWSSGTVAGRAAGIAP